jgi:hypothetical protein
MMNSTPSTTTTTTTDERLEEPVWKDIFLDIFYPHDFTILAARRILWLDDERVRDLMAEALARVPEGLDLGRDEDGHPIIATEVLFQIVVVEHRFGFEALIHPRNKGWYRRVLGWKTLDEYQERQRRGEGVVKGREVKDPREGRTHTGGWFASKRYRFWVWRDGA